MARMSRQQVTGGAAPREEAADRVVRSHAQTRATVRFALAFLVAAALAAALGGRTHAGEWFALHLLLAGGVVTAISGVSLMLAVTWSAAPAPPERWVTLQRGCVISGAVAVGVSRRLEMPAGVVGAAAGVYLAGLIGLIGLLVWAARRGSQRRFDPAVAAYVAAVVAGVVGSSLGAVAAVVGPTVELRSAHVTLNVLGLVGLTVGGTLPFFASTVGRSRMAARATTRRLVLTLIWQTASVSLAAVGVAAGSNDLAAAGWFGFALGIAAALVWMPPLRRRQLTWAGPRLAALWIGSLWWVAAVIATGVELVEGHSVLGGRWLPVLVVAGYGQIVWGSLAYLLPMLRGGGPARLSEGFSLTRSWTGFGAVNAAGVAFVVGARPVAAVALAIWVLEGAVRSAAVGLARLDRPDSGGSAA